MKVGDKVYWLATTGYEAISCGKIVAVAKDAASGCPLQVVVDRGDELVMFNTAYQAVYLTSEQAFRDGAAKLSAQVKDANARLFSLVDSMHKLAAEEQKLAPSQSGSMGLVRC
jgi:hypothetical protein